MMKGEYNQFIESSYHRTVVPSNRRTIILYTLMR